MSRLPNKSPEPTAVGAYRSAVAVHAASRRDRKSTRLNSSHQIISYAVFCLKKKKTSIKSSHQSISYAVFCLNKKKKNCKTNKEEMDESMRIDVRTRDTDVKDNRLSSSFTTK